MTQFCFVLLQRNATSYRIWPHCGSILFMTSTNTTPTPTPFSFCCLHFLRFNLVCMYVVLFCNVARSIPKWLFCQENVLLKSLYPHGVKSFLLEHEFLFLDITKSISTHCVSSKTTVRATCKFYLPDLIWKLYTFLLALILQIEGKFDFCNNCFSQLIPGTRKRFIVQPDTVNRLI